VNIGNVLLLFMTRVLNLDTWKPSLSAWYLEEYEFLIFDFRWLVQNKCQEAAFLYTIYPCSVPKSSA